MKIANTISELEKALAPLRKSKKQIGFVPTMGALHKGHISLIDIAKAENDVVVCSIFVNPTQFNDPKDLERYPRPLKEDEKMLTKAGCDVVFIPSVKEMYPNNDFSTLQEDFGNLDKVMEGKARPGHFAGMITIVNKLFVAVKPHRAYFGSKDFQQLTLVKHFVKTHNIPIEIQSCPIVREPDGLAMSSRNRLLTAKERKQATLIPETMKKVKELWGKKSVMQIKQFVEDKLGKNGSLKLDYFEISYADTLIPLEESYTHPTPLAGRESRMRDWQIGNLQVAATSQAPIVACIAVFDGKIRLIDNVMLI